MIPSALEFRHLDIQFATLVEHLDTLLRNRQTVNYCQRAGYKQFTAAPRSVVCLVMTLFSAIGEYQSFRFRDHVTAPLRAGVEVSGGGSSRPGVATQQHQQLLMSIHLYCCISLSRLLCTMILPLETPSRRV